MSTTNSLKKQFILDTLVPYFEDPQTRGYNKDTKLCSYLTKDGKKCAVGKHMKEGPWQKYNWGLVSLLNTKTLEEILTDEAFAIGLTVGEWASVQNVHDNIKTNSSIFSKKDYRDRLLSFITGLERATGENFEELRLININ